MIFFELPIGTYGDSLTHIEVAKHPLQAYRYCSEDVAPDGKVKEIPDKASRIKSNAEPPAIQGSRSDLADAAALAVTSGIRAVHREMPAVAVRYSHHLQRHVSMLHPGHAKKDCEVFLVRSPDDVPAGAGFVYRLNGNWFLDDAIDREAIWLYADGVLTGEKNFLYRKHTWLMNVKGSTYPATFTKVYEVQNQSGGGSLVLPAPTSCQTSCQNPGEKKLVRHGLLGILNGVPVQPRKDYDEGDSSSDESNA